MYIEEWKHCYSSVKIQGQGVWSSRYWPQWLKMTLPDTIWSKSCSFGFGTSLYLPNLNFSSELDTYLTHVQSSAVARSSVLSSEWVHIFTAERSGWAVSHYYACLLLNLPLTAVTEKVKWSFALLIFASAHFNFHWFVCWVTEGHIGINVFSSLVCTVPTVHKDDNQTPEDPKAYTVSLHLVTKQRCYSSKVQVHTSLRKHGYFTQHHYRRFSNIQHFVDREKMWASIIYGEPAIPGIQMMPRVVPFHL